MSDHDKSRRELLAELETLRKRVSLLESEGYQQFRASEEKWRSVVSNAPAFVALIDRDGTIKFLNRAQPGMTVEQSIGRTVFDYTEPAYHSTLRKCLSAAFEQGENGFFASVAAGPNNHNSWYETYVAPVTVAGEIVAATFIATDITRRKQALQALEKTQGELEHRVRQRTTELTKANEQLSREIEERRMAEGQLRVIYDGMVDGLLIADIASKRFVRANCSIRRMLGYSVDELLGMSVMDIHPPADVPRVLEKFQARADHEIIVSNSRPVVRKDGSVFYADITATHIMYGGKRCLLGFFRDITERKEARERLEREHQMLLDLLKSQDRQRQLIAYEIHDGLAQQLVGAIMRFETVHFMAGRNLEEALQNCDAGLEMARQALFEARRLIAGLRPPILDELGVVAAIGHMVHDISGEGGPEIEFHTEIHFDRLEPTLENTIYRIVQECLTNARRHSQSEKIRVGLVQEKDRLRIEVTDWGIGFDPTAQRDGSFGLEGIQERARLIGGSATVSSAPGAGTQVIADLPLPDSH